MISIFKPPISIPKTNPCVRVYLKKPFRLTLRHFLTNLLSLLLKTIFILNGYYRLITQNPVPSYLLSKT